MTTRSKIVGSFLLVMFIGSGLPSDDKRSTTGNAELAGKTLASLAAAYNAHKAESIAELFSPAGEFIDGDGNNFQGRDVIAREFTALFDVNPKYTIEFRVDDVRELSPGLLTFDATAKFAESAAPADLRIEFVAFLARQADGRWLLASIRSHGDDDDLETPHSRLRQLEWLIGDWVDESDESTMHMSSRWSADGNFIVTDFTIRVAGRDAMTGTQRIGWDGTLNRFKSWVFDSEGGHTEGVWVELEDRWIVKSTGVNSAGDAGSATHSYERKGADAYLFSVTDRIIGDDEQPDFTSRVVRKPPDPAKGASSGARRTK